MPVYDTKMPSPSVGKAVRYFAMINLLNVVEAVICSKTNPKFNGVPATDSCYIAQYLTALNTV